MIGRVPALPLFSGRRGGLLINEGILALASQNCIVSDHVRFYLQLALGEALRAEFRDIDRRLLAGDDLR